MVACWQLLAVLAVAAKGASIEAQGLSPAESCAADSQSPSNRCHRASAKGPQLLQWQTAVGNSVVDFAERSFLDVTLAGDAFSPAEGGSGRACRGANVQDNAASNYAAHWRSMTLAACQTLCVQTPRCRGVEHSPSKCEVWTQHIQATVASPGVQCLHYNPWTAVGAESDRACRGTGVDVENFAGPVGANSLDSCRERCIQTIGCKGVEFGGGQCELWIRPIETSALVVGRSCFQYQPFVAVDGGNGRACRGANEGDNHANYYYVLQVSTLENCKVACAGAASCVGVEYQTGRCEIWTRPGGISSSAAFTGATCLRFGGSDPTEVGDAFRPADGGLARACRGATSTDNSENYYVAHLGVPSLEDCKALCVSNPGCRGVEFSSSKCEVWTRTIEATVSSTGVECHQYQPFTPVDGGQDRSCRGSVSSDLAESYYIQHGHGSASTLAACEALCVGTHGCKGIDFSQTGCKVWIRPQGIGTSVKASGSTCQRYEPFLGADTGRDRACRGASPADTWPSYYTSFGLSEVNSLLACRRRCLQTAGCKGLQFDNLGCKVWTRPRGIGATAASQGSTCLRLGSSDVEEAFDAFWPVDGGVGRACRGSSSNDLSPTYFSAIGPAKVTSLEACKGLCVATPGCTGIDFGPEDCKIWTRASGVQATAAVPSRQCLRYDPLEAVDGGEDRACRGASAGDNLASYFTVHYAASLLACRTECAATRDCKGIEFANGRCEVWTRSGGIQASVASSGFQCNQYQPFVQLGALGQACRGASSSDDSTSYYTLYGPNAVASLEACKALCSGMTGCKGVDYSSAGCKVWNRSIRATASVPGALCLRLGPPELAEDADAFQPADGAIGRACRGGSTSDSSPAYYTAYSADVATTLDQCKALCVKTVGCKGIEFSGNACEVWTRAAGIGTTVSSPGFQCYRYEPFAPVGGFSDRACRGGTTDDNSPSNYILHGVSSLDACKALCVEARNCKGIEFSGGSRCEVWTRSGGILASVPAVGVQCLVYEPFAVAGGQDRACRGETASDNWPNYYRVYDDSPPLSLDQCKALCIGSLDCKGVEYAAGRCEVWTRPAGIGSTTQATGSVCLRFGVHDPREAASAFAAVDGGEGRSCRGATETDVLPDYYRTVGPLEATSPEICSGLCVAEPACQGIDYSSSQGCRLWTRPGGIGLAVPAAGHTCLRYDPFSPADGGIDRVCRGASASDNSASHYTFFNSSVITDLQGCKERCASTAGCKGIEFGASGCEVWTRQQGIQATAPYANRQCLRYEPFSPAGGGVDQACRGGHSSDDSAGYYQLHSPVDSIGACKALCMAQGGCHGIDYSANNCKVWTRPVGTTSTSGSGLCMRYGAPDAAAVPDSFLPVDGASNRACRGATATDNSPQYYTEYGPVAAPSIDVCKALCVATENCTAMEFSNGKCEVWTRGGGAGATVAAPGYQCFNYQPFVAFDGFPDRACRGADATDDFDGHKTTHGVASLANCKALCVGNPNCKGIEYGSGRCEVWTREQGIGASVPAAGFQCLLYEPFSGVDGGKDRACRGADSSDNWPSYYSVRAAASLTACKSLCVGTAGCKGLEYSSGRCELWTRRQGVGSSVPQAGSVCLRLGKYDLVDTASSFTPVDQGTNRACRGSSASDDSPDHYKLIGPAKATSQEACMAFCIATPRCQGIDFSSQGCKVWTSLAIGTSVPRSGHVCLRYEPLVPVDGGVDRACRGASAADNSASYFTVSTSGAASLSACRQACAATPGCKGLEYSAGRCEIWTRSGGIRTSIPAPGFTCLSHEPFTLIDGGRDRSCRGGSITDNATSNYDLYDSSQAYSVEACKALCVARPGCQGVEYRPGQCQVWTRPAGIRLTAASAGSLCLRYRALEEAGVEETWPRIGELQLLSSPSMCLGAAGGSSHNGNRLQRTTCSGSANGQRFRIAGDGSGHISWGTKCLDVSGGVDADGTAVQLWDCQDPPHMNMQFLMPTSSAGPIRWARHPDKCLDTTSGNLQIRTCGDMIRPGMRFVLPPGSSYRLKPTSYVTHYLPWFLGPNTDAACSRNPTTCSYRDDHWCSSYGNSFYASNKGAYDITDQRVMDQQLDEMKDAGFDGLWIDYQSANWDSYVDRLIAGTRVRGMGFSILVDDTINADIIERSRTAITRWVQEPHYFRHQGFPVIPVFNSEATVWADLPFTAIFLSRAEVPKPAWAADTYTWVHGDDGFLANYYKQEHPMFLSGSAFRGFRDCYLDRSIGFPHVGMLGPSLQQAGERKPMFVQLNTWNDYTEGTQLEPSWLRQENTCFDVCSPTYAGQACLTTASCGSSATFTDCTKPVGRAFGLGDARCGATGNLSARADLDQIKAHILAERAAEAVFLSG